jgi:hypothetical protein
VSFSLSTQLVYIYTKLQIIKILTRYLKSSNYKSLISIFYYELFFCFFIDVRVKVCLTNTISLAYSLSFISAFLPPCLHLLVVLCTKCGRVGLSGGTRKNYLGGPQFFLIKKLNRKIILYIKI